MKECTETVYVTSRFISEGLGKNKQTHTQLNESGMLELV